VPTDADQTETPDTDAPEAEVTDAVETPAEAPEAPAAPVAKPAEPAKPNKSGRTFTDAERAARKERVMKAKDALARSVGMKGDHVVAARASLKSYLQRLNDPNQPDDARFEMLIEAPFRQPPKKKTNDRRF
jgi:chromosome condensin MukBEF ATPase and DNA-binding subunit MukB